MVLVVVEYSVKRSYKVAVDTQEEAASIIDSMLVEGRLTSDDVVPVDSRVELADDEEMDEGVSLIVHTAEIEGEENE